MKTNRNKIFIYSGIAILFAGLIWWAIPDPEYCQKNFVQRDHQVVMFSTRWCPYCKRARDFFNEKGIQFCEYNVYKGSPNLAAFEDLGEGVVPLIVIGDEVYIGFSRTIIEHALLEQSLISE